MSTSRILLSSGYNICLTSESHSGWSGNKSYPLIYIWRKMAIDEKYCQKCFRGHLDRLQTWDTRMPPTFILSCGFLPHLTNSVSGSFFGSKVFLFPIIITSITYLPAAVVCSFTGFWSNSVNWKVSQAPHPIFIMVYKQWRYRALPYHQSLYIHMYKYCKQLKEPGGQQCHLGRK